MKNLIFILLFIPLVSFSQSKQKKLRFLENYEKIELPNGMTVLHIKTDTTFKYITYRFIVDYKPFKERHAVGSSEILAYILDGEIYNKSQFSRRLVSNKNALREDMYFLDSLITKPNFTDEKINKAKKYYKYLLQSLNQNDSLINKYSAKVCYGKHHPYGEYMTNKTIDTINRKDIQNAYFQIFRPENCYLVIYGNAKTADIEKLANQYFGTWQQPKKGKLTEFESPTPIEPQVKFINTIQPDSYVSLSYPLDFKISDKNYIESQIFKKVLYLYLEKEIVNDFNISEQLKVDIQSNSNISRLDIKVKTKYNSVKTVVEEIYRVLAEIKKDKINQSFLDKAKLENEQNFNNALINEYNICLFAYNIDYYELDKNFYTNFTKKSNKVNKSDIKKLAKGLLPTDNMTWTITGDESIVACELLYLAETMKVYYYDKKYEKPHKIIAKGFGSKKIINDYLDFCYAENTIENITIDFEANYQIIDTVFEDEYRIDTLTYKMKGQILKKYPNLYYYKSDFYIKSDTLFHQIETYDGNKWLDSLATERNILKGKVAKKNLHKVYLFPEQFYDELKFSTEFDCTTTLIDSGLYKVVIKTNQDIQYHDFFDIKTKEKKYTEKHVWNGSIFEYKETYKYDDYQKINKKVKIPFTIHQTYKNISVTTRITNVDVKTNLRKKQFKIKK